MSITRLNMMASFSHEYEYISDGEVGQMVIYEDIE
jgi:hypothetical protein